MFTKGRVEKPGFLLGVGDESSDDVECGHITHKPVNKVDIELTDGSGGGK